MSSWQETLDAWGTASTLTRTVDLNGGNHEIARQLLISADRSNPCTMKITFVTWILLEFEPYLLREGLCRLAL